MNAKRTFTVEEIEQALFTNDRQADVQDVAETLRQQVSYSDSAELVTAIIDNTKEAAARDTKSAESFKCWNSTDRLLWIAKEAFVMGQISGISIAEAATHDILHGLQA